jgi:hypothetical protein
MQTHAQEHTRQKYRKFNKGFRVLARSLDC